MIGPDRPRLFPTTRWSVVRRTLSENPGEAREAVAALCEAYWYPLYAYIRRSGHGAHDAEDLTQSLFVRLLEREAMAVADPTKGKLRSFLLTCARNFLHDAFDRANAQRRGAALLISFDAATAEERYAAEPVDELTADRLFQRRWAITLLEASLELLGEEYRGQGKGALFETLRPFLGFGGGPELRYEQVGAALGMTIGTVKSHVFRLRQRWRALLFEQVATTLADPTPEEIKAELMELLGAV